MVKRHMVSISLLILYFLQCQKNFAEVCLCTIKIWVYQFFDSTFLFKSYSASKLTCFSDNLTFNLKILSYYSFLGSRFIEVVSLNHWWIHKKYYQCIKQSKRKSLLCISLYSASKNWMKSNIKRIDFCTWKFMYILNGMFNVYW